MEHVLSLTAIREQKATLSRVILDAQAQMADLEVAERIVLRFGQAASDQRPSDDDIADLLGDVAVEQKPTIARLNINGVLTTRSLIISVLRQSPDSWMTANEISERASSIKGRDVPLATVSPALSLMKNDGLIVRDGLKVTLAERLKENGLQSGSPPRSPETALAAQ